MTPRQRAILQVAILIAVGGFLFVLFPNAVRFAEGAARNIRYLWWMVLLVALAIWLIWGINRKPK